MTTSKNASGDTCVVTVRLTAAQFECLRRIGGAAWIRSRLALVAKKGNIPAPVKQLQRAVERGYVMGRSTVRIPTMYRDLYNYIGGAAWLRERLDARLKKEAAA